jgi:signal peptidase II
VSPRIPSGVPCYERGVPRVSTPPPTQRLRLTVAALVVGVGLALDQLTKQWAFTSLRGEPAEVLIPYRLELDFAFNPGSAFGMFADQPLARPVFIVITLLALLYMGALLWRLPGVRAAWNGTLALALMVAGALGNLVDRLVRVYDVRLPLGDGVPFWMIVDHPVELANSVLRNRKFVDIPRHGVVDFIVVHYWHGKRWPTFNVADICLVVGVGLFVVYLVRQGRSDPTGSTPG